MNGEIDDHVLSSFMSEQQMFLHQNVKNISEATDSERPSLKKEVPKSESFADYYSMFTKFFSFQILEPPKKQTFKNDGLKGEPYDEIVESIKVRLNQMIEEAPQNIKNEFRSMLSLKKQNFFTQNKSD